MGEEREGESIKHIPGLRGGAAVHVHKGALITSHDTRKGEEEEREGRWWAVEGERERWRGGERGEEEEGEVAIELGNGAAHRLWRSDWAVSRDKGKRERMEEG